MKKRLPGMYISTSATTPGVAIPAHDGWLSIIDENRGRASFEARAFSGSGTTVSLGIETATDPRSPDASPTAITNTRTSNGVTDPKSPPDSVSMLDKQMYRYVWILLVTSGTGGCWVSGYGETFKA